MAGSRDAVRMTEEGVRALLGSQGRVQVAGRDHAELVKSPT